MNVPSGSLKDGCQIIYNISISSLPSEEWWAFLSSLTHFSRSPEREKRKQSHLPFLGKAYEASLQLPFHLEGYLPEEIS